MKKNLLLYFRIFRQELNKKNAFFILLGYFLGCIVGFPEISLFYWVVSVIAMCFFLYYQYVKYKFNDDRW